jgi:hypothetical protein
MEYKAHYHRDENNPDREIAQKMRTMTDLMEETIRRGVQEGAFREVDARMLAILLEAVTEGMLQLKKLGVFENLKITDVDFRKVMGEIIGRGILNTREQEIADTASRKLSTEKTGMASLLARGVDNQKGS